MTADLKILKRLRHMAIVEGEDGFDLLTMPSYVGLGPRCWLAIGRELRNPSIGLETQSTGLTWPDAEKLAEIADGFFADEGRKR